MESDHEIHKRNRLVVDHQFQGLVTAFEELDDRADAEAHYFRQEDLPLAQLNYDGNLEAHDALEVRLPGFEGMRVSGAVQRGIGTAHVLAEPGACAILPVFCTI